MPVLPRYFRITGPERLRPAVARMLQAENFEFTSEPFSANCYRLLTEPRPLGSSLAAFFGYIYIQDRSSMLPPLALAPMAGSAVLDLCASPGSKTGFLAELAGPEGMVLANEPNPARIATLRANMNTLDYLNVVTCQYEGVDLPLFADSWEQILLDPPCSGWGTENRNPGVRKLWSGEKAEKLIKIQRALLNKAATLLAPGGRLLYSTCTTNPDENERQAVFAIEELGLELVPLSPFSGFHFCDSQLPGTLLVDGPASGAQGFYLALLRKPESCPRCEIGNEYFIPPADAREMLVGTLDLSGMPPGTVGIFNGKARFLPRQAGKILPRALRWQGRNLGEIDKNGRHSPNPRLKSLASFSECVAQVDEIKALRSFLSGTARVCESSAELAALRWEDLPLGLCKVRKGRLISAFPPLR